MKNIFRTCTYDDKEKEELLGIFNNTLCVAILLHVVC